jgi:hypothetical protein
MYSTILPELMSITVFILTLFCLQAGHTPTYMPNYSILSLNTTGLKDAYHTRTQADLPIHDVCNLYMMTTCSGYWSSNSSPLLENVTCSPVSWYCMSPNPPFPLLSTLNKRKKLNPPPPSEILPLSTTLQRPTNTPFPHKPNIPLPPPGNPRRLRPTLQPPTPRRLHLLRHRALLARHRHPLGINHLLVGRSGEFCCFVRFCTFSPFSPSPSTPFTPSAPWLDEWKLIESKTVCINIPPDRLRNHHRSAKPSSGTYKR